MSECRLCLNLPPFSESTELQDPQPKILMNSADAIEAIRAINMKTKEYCIFRYFGIRCMEPTYGWLRVASRHQP